MHRSAAAHARNGTLARSIAVPVTLPCDRRGRALATLSYSALSKFLECPDDFRRHYILRERAPLSGAAFLGRVLDETISLYYTLSLRGPKPDEAQLQEAFQERWRAAIERERHVLGVAFEAELGERAAFAVGQRALALALRRLVPKLGRASAVQRSFAFKLAPELHWAISGRVDLDTVRTLRHFADERGEIFASQDEGEQEPQLARDGAEAPASALAHAVSEQQVQGVVDYKVKNTLISAQRAAYDLQASLYLAERWLQGAAAYDFSFAQLGKPCRGRRKGVSASLVRTRRSPAELRATLVRVAQVAAQISACYERFGPERPWGFAPPGHWKCDERFCAWAADRSCPVAALEGPPLQSAGGKEGGCDDKGPGRRAA